MFQYRAIAFNVCTGTTSPNTYKLEVVGNAGKTVGGTAWVDMSDARVKNILGDIDSALDMVKRLHPLKYEWNEKRTEVWGAGEPGVHYGFIAQEMKEVIPEFISKDNKGYYWYNPSGFEAILTAAIQEQQKQIQELQEKIRVLEAKLNLR